MKEFNHLDFERLKRKTLLDIIRRTMANPGNVKKVVDALARDWNPTCMIDSKGKASIVISPKPKP